MVLGFVLGHKVHVRPARSILSNALNFRCSELARLARIGFGGAKGGSKLRGGIGLADIGGGTAAASSSAP
jgi:hypothetical protein